MRHIWEKWVGVGETKKARSKCEMWEKVGCGIWEKWVGVGETQKNQIKM